MTFVKQRKSIIAVIKNFLLLELINSKILSSYKSQQGIGMCNSVYRGVPTNLIKSFSRIPTSRSPAHTIKPFQQAKKSLVEYIERIYQSCINLSRDLFTDLSIQMAFEKLLADFITQKP